VFLRHKAFEALERIRSREHTAAATKLNAIFRARIAYLPIWDAYRDEVSKHCATVYKESCDVSVTRESLGKQLNSGDALVLIQKFESEMCMSIHNPLLRSGTSRPVHSFKWRLVEGIWVKNPETFSWIMHQYVLCSTVHTVCSSKSQITPFSQCWTTLYEDNHDRL
jgi:hypothetical protein